MISKIKKGGGFKGVVSYCTEKKDAKIIGGNMAEESKNGITREFSAISSQNYACKKPVFHASLSLPPGQNLTNEQWNDVAKSYLQKIGFADDNQYLVVRHADKEHDHNHLTHRQAYTYSMSLADDCFWRGKESHALDETHRERRASYHGGPKRIGECANVYGSSGSLVSIQLRA